MRLFLLRVFIILGYIITLMAILGIALALYGPLHPGSTFFPIQAFSEQQFGLIYNNPVTKADYLLNLVDRRISDLLLRAGSVHEYISMEYLDRSINQAALAISTVPQDKASDVLTRFITLAKRAEDGLNQLKRAPLENPTAFNALRAKVQTIQHMVGTVKVQNNELVLVPAITVNSSQAITSTLQLIHSANGLIPWPAGSPGAVHAFFTLAGQHAVLQCIDCHNEGIYFGTPNLCIECHSDKTPNAHYPGDCNLCHTPVSWTDIHFDHRVVSNKACSDCHEKDKPANHYNGDCGACHITENWTTVTFDHAVAGAVDCISCHAQKAPANHYAGQCSNCHNTSNWTSVVFDHTGFTDCISCHAKDAPANHYAGQCSNCHSTKGPWTNAHFNHSGFTDCSACHANKAPANHYPYQCSLCHSTSSWAGGNFSHSSSYPDCISCHARDRPSEHDSGQCSNCHSTSSWNTEHNPSNVGMIINGEAITISCTMCHTSNALVLEGIIFH